MMGQWETREALIGLGEGWVTLRKIEESVAPVSKKNLAHQLRRLERSGLVEIRECTTKRGNHNEYKAVMNDE